MEKQIDPTAQILSELLGRFKTMTECLAAHEILLCELIRIAPADTTQKLLDTLKANVPNNPHTVATYAFASEIVSAALNGVPSKNMRDILKVIPGGKSDS